MARNISTVICETSASKVWAVLTEPKQVKVWQYGSDLITDWSVGSEIRFRTEWNGDVFEQWGTVLEFLPTKLIRYSLFAPRPGLKDSPENYFEMNYILTEDSAVTKLEIVQIDNRAGAAEEVPQDETTNPILKK